MYRYKLARTLKRLRREGEKLAEDRESIRQDDVRLWLATVSDILRGALPEDSTLNEQLRANCLDQASKNTAVPRDQLVQIVKEATAILPRAITIAKMSIRSSDAQDLERETRLIIGDIFVHSRWFIVSLAVLAGAAAFAIGGVIKIRDVQIDLKKLADDAVADVKSDILEQAEDIEKDLNEFTENQKRRLRQTIRDKINSAIQEITGASDGLAGLKEKLQSFDNTVLEVDAAVTRLEGKKGIESLRTLSAFVGQSQWLFLAVLILPSLTLAVSAVLFKRGSRSEQLAQADRANR